MDEAKHEGDGPFDRLDPELTVFALANGLDLAKSDDYRRLEWFSEGLERAILIYCDETGRLHLQAMTWRSGKTEARSERTVGDALAVDEVKGALERAIEIANELSAPSGE
ncbi:MAG: hypothetical protein OEN56_06370 [Gemmatimonadota bacterium]|nr:hypothetical protein [Gemmatimonadota bacterium]MDH3423248.1 hypothetical protein [Gemmatimonadota bacterium]